MSDGVNFPLVLQQSGDVSRLQELTQRQGLEQQIDAVERLSQETKRQMEQVQRSERSDAENRIQAEGEGGGKGGKRQGPQGRKKPAEGQAAEEPVETKREGLVDVIV